MQPKIRFTREPQQVDISNGDTLNGSRETHFIEKFRGVDGNACIKIDVITGSGYSRAISYQLGTHKKGWEEGEVDTFEPLNPISMNQEAMDRHSLELLDIIEELGTTLKQFGVNPDFSKGYKQMTSLLLRLQVLVISKQNKLFAFTQDSII
jgi:hypothetical protein